MIKRKLTKLTPFFQSLVVVFIASLFVMSIVYAATTIGSSITTGGDLIVDGEEIGLTSDTNLLHLAANSFLINGSASTTLDLLVGRNATTTGNLSIGGFASTTGYLKVGGGIFDLATGTATTTLGIFARDKTTGTSTVSIGDITAGNVKKQVGCLEMAATGGAYYRCYIDTAAGSSTALVCVAGRCN